MKEIVIKDVKEGIIADNDLVAESIREKLRAEGSFFINVMGSPGCGKTTFIIRTINELKKDIGIAVMEADVDSDTDARIVSETGADVIQLHTGGSCHMDAAMTMEGLKEFGEMDHDLIILENVGNLVCPAEFDVGANLNVMILSVAEGDDKPLKYPLMFRTSDVLIINKTDAKEAFDFDEDIFLERVRNLNGDIKVFTLSALHGEGFAKWMDFIGKAVVKR